MCFTTFNGIIFREQTCFYFMDFTRNRPRYWHSKFVKLLTRDRRYTRTTRDEREMRRTRKRKSEEKNWDDKGRTSTRESRREEFASGTEMKNKVWSHHSLQDHPFN